MTIKSTRTYYQPILAKMAVRETPAYRVIEDPYSCNTGEILAAVIGGPKQIEISHTLLSHYGDIRSIHKASLTEMTELDGVTKNIAVRIKAAFNLGFRLQSPPDARPSINSPADGAALVMADMMLLEKEQLRVLSIDRRNRLLSNVRVYEGSANSAQVRIGELFKDPIARHASSILVAHNHPSGDPTPSPDDVAVTRAIVQAGKLLDIEVLDHLIIGDNKWISLKERGLGF